MALALGALAPATAMAHAFAAPYTLPVPFTMYAFGASAALVLSFVLVVLAMMRPVAPGRPIPRSAARDAPRAARSSLVPRAIGLLLLTFTIATGLAGTQNAWANWNMTFFWIVFVLGVPYLVAIVGDF